MNKKKQKWSTREYYILLCLVLAVAAITRLVALEQYPRGTYTDEAYGAYIAQGLLQSGIDDRGYSFPVYFVAWGSGMNALYLYLGMLFFKLFGVSLLVYRLPQVLFGILGVLALAVICKELFNRKLAIFAAFALTVSPWHIMMCRFGLESNLAPNMFLIALMFLVLGLKKKNLYLIPAALTFGLTLYCYAITWLVIPVFFVIMLSFCWKWIPRKKITFWFVGILFVMALPLLVFLAINFGLIPEIRTSLFSIPKLTGFRGDELAVTNYKRTAMDFLKMVFIRQGDTKELLSCFKTGSYYYFITPFIIFGLLFHLVFLIKNFKNGENDLSVLFPAWLFAATLISIVNSNPTMIHINMVHIPIIFYGAYGIYKLSELCKSKMIGYASVVFYALSLTVFIKYYTAQDLAELFGEKPYEAVMAAKEIAGEDGIVTIFGYTTYKFPNLLWREKIDIEDYAENAVYDDDLFFAELTEYRNYRYITDATLDSITGDGVYVLFENRMGDFKRLGFQVQQVNESYAVAAMSIP